MPQPDHVDATFYAQVVPVWNSWQKIDGIRKLDSAKVVRITQAKPDHPESGAVVVKLTIRVPASSFLPFTPEIIAVLPEDEDPAVVQAINSILNPA